MNEPVTNLPGTNLGCVCLKEDDLYSFFNPELAFWQSLKAPLQSIWYSPVYEEAWETNALATYSSRCFPGMNLKED